MDRTKENLRRIRAYNKSIRDTGEWVEEDHPRSKNGQFTSGAGESKTPEIPKEAKVGEILKHIAEIFASSKTESTIVSDKKISLESELGKSLNSLGEHHFGKVNSFLANAPDSFLKCMAKAEKKLKINDGNIPEGETSRYANKGIYFNMEVAAKGDDWNYPYEIFFHELAHNLDAALSVRGRDYSAAYKNELLDKTIRSEVDAIITEAIKEVRKNDAYSSDEYVRGKAIYHLEKKLNAIPAVERASIADIFSGATMNEVYLGTGHRTSYWTMDHKLLASEAFADMCSSLTTSPARVKIYQELFPKSYGVFLDMLKEAGK